MMGDQRLIFLHMPKTGGLTLRRLLLRVYKGAAFAPPMPTPERYLAYLRGEAPRPTVDPDGSGNERFLDAFRALPEAERVKKRAFMEHLAFGVHEQLPGPSTYITMLRDPVDRVLALHHHRALLHGVTEPLREYVMSRRDRAMRNYQTMTLVSHSNRIRFDNCTPAMLDTAKQHLVDHFAVAGVTERWDETALVLADVFGWPQPYYRRYSLAPGRLRRADVPEDVIHLIEEDNAFDIELHRFARERFEARLARDHPDMERRVRRLRAGNVVWNRVYPPVAATRRAYYRSRSSAALTYRGLRGR